MPSCLFHGDGAGATVQALVQVAPHDARHTLLLNVARRLLTFEAGGEIRDAEGGVAAAGLILQKLHQHLSPVVGDFGLLALLTRSLKLTQPAFACLQGIDTLAPAAVMLEQLSNRLRQQTPDAIADVVPALLVTLINLLSTFIGEGLTWKLLHNAWPEALPIEAPSGEKP